MSSRRDNSYPEPAWGTRKVVVITRFTIACALTLGLSLAAARESSNAGHRRLLPLGTPTRMRSRATAPPTLSPSGAGEITGTILACAEDARMRHQYYHGFSTRFAKEYESRLGPLPTGMDVYEEFLRLRKLGQKRHRDRDRQVVGVRLPQRFEGLFELSPLARIARGHRFGNQAPNGRHIELPGMHNRHQVD